MTRTPQPSGGPAGDVVWYLVAGGGRPSNGNPDASAAPTRRRYIHQRELSRLRAILGGRDLAVLRALSQLHYATGQQLERMHFRGRDTRPEAARRAATRMLARLHEHGAVERLPRRVGGTWAGSAPYVWRLSPLGRRLVDDPSERARQPGLSHLAHELAVGDLVVRLHEAQQQSALEILQLETQPACWRPYVGRRGRRTLLKPDLRLTLGIGDDELHWYVEVDRGTEHRPAIRRKIDAYLTAWHQRAEEGRAGVEPRILWVVPDEDRAIFISNECPTAPPAASTLFAVVPVDRAIEVLFDLT